MDQEEILYVKDLLGINGNVLDYESFSRKYNITENFLTFYGVLQSIPKEWKDILNLNEVQVNPQTKINQLKLVPKVPKFIYHELITYKMENPKRCLNKWNNALKTSITMYEWLIFFQYTLHIQND